MKKLIYAGVILGMMLLSLSATPQQATATLDSSRMLIGDQVPLYLEFSATGDVDVKWPYRQDTVTGKIEIISQTELDSVVGEGGQVSLRQKLTVTSFDTGHLVIPPFAFSYQKGADSAVEKTDPLLLYVRPMEVDTTQPVRAIKGPMEAPVTFAEVLPWLLAFLAVVLLALIIWYILKRKREHKPVLPVKEKVREPADVEALKALEQLRAKKLWQQDMVKDYYSELSHIVRVYIERSYAVPAVESTSGEILGMLMNTSIAREEIKRLEHLFEVADMAKFARMEPLPSENDKAMSDAVAFVENTRQRPTDNTGNMTEKGGSV
jgi:hypothetical protein